MSDEDYPLIPFRFHVNFTSVAVAAGGGGTESWEAAFCECTGLEATMEPKVIKSGGSNYGAAQRVGPVTFGTVILKRGIIARNRDVWGLFSHVNELGKSAARLNVKITVEAPGEKDGAAGLTVELTRALPVKFKCGDLNARASEVAIEELHLAHEGLSLS